MRLSVSSRTVVVVENPERNTDAAAPDVVGSKRKANAEGRVHEARHIIVDPLRMGVINHV